MLERLAESDARIDHDPLAVDAGLFSHPDPFLKIGEDLSDQIGIDRVLLHVAGRAPDMHDDQGRAVLGDDFAHVRREAQPADVVHDGSSRLQRFFRYGRLIGVYGKGNGELSRQTLDERDDPAQLFFLRHGLCSRPCRLSADIDDISSGRYHCPCMDQGALGVGVPAAVGKGIGGHVQDAHYLGAAGQVENLAPAINLIIGAQVVVKHRPYFFRKVGNKFAFRKQKGGVVELTDGAGQDQLPGAPVRAVN